MPGGEFFSLSFMVFGAPQNFTRFRLVSLSRTSVSLPFKFLWSVRLLTILHVFDCFATTITTLNLVQAEVGVEGSRFNRTYTSSSFWRRSCNISIPVDGVALF